MTDRSGAPTVTVRHEPVQARAAQRIETLLDAAASVVVQHGIEHLTTALVAEHAGASIGTVYRYFPDRVAVLVALAERNYERMRLALERALAVEYADWQEAMEGLVAAMVDTFREVPSFRALRTGEGLDLGPKQRDAVAPQFAREVGAYFSEHWGAEMGDEQLERIELAVGGLDALVTYAFLHDPDGDPRYLTMGLEFARWHLAVVFGEQQG